MKRTSFAEPLRALFVCIAMLYPILPSQAQQGPRISITVNRAPGTPWEDQTPFTVTMNASLQFQDSLAGGKGTPLFKVSIEEGASFAQGEQTTGFPLRASGPSSARAGQTNYLALTVDPVSGKQVVWASLSQGAFGVLDGFQADWEYQLRYYSGSPGGDASKLELGTVANQGFWSGNEIASGNYSVDLDFNDAEALINPRLSGYAAREILAGRLSLERAESLIADPIDAASGEQIMHHEFLRQEGLFPFAFEITGSTLGLAPSAVGAGWQHNYQAILSDDGGGILTVRWSGTKRNSFEPVPGQTGLWKGSGEFDQYDRIRLLGNGSYRHEKKDGLWHVFSSGGRLIRVETRAGLGADLSYDGDLLDRITDPVGGFYIELTHDAEGRITRIEDAAGRWVSFSHDTGRLSGFDRSQGTDLPVLRCVYSPDLRGRILSCEVGEVSSTGELENDFILFENTYDLAGRITRQYGYGGSARRGVSARFVYYEDLENERVITLAADTSDLPGGGTLGNDLAKEIYEGTRPLPEDDILYVHDSKLRLIEKREDRSQVVAVTQWTYGTGSYPLTRTSNLSPDISWTYDSSGNQTERTTSTGKAATWSYDAAGNLTATTDETGATESFTYNSKNQLLRHTDATGAATNYSYHPDGAVASITSGAGLVNSISTTGGLPGTETVPGGAQTTYGYDAAGRMVEKTDPGGRAWVYSWDDLGNLLEVNQPDGTSIAGTFDCREPNRPLRTSLTDENGKTTTWEYRETWDSQVTNNYLARPLSAVEDEISRTRMLYHVEAARALFGISFYSRSEALVLDAPAGYGGDLTGKRVVFNEALFRDGSIKYSFDTTYGSSVTGGGFNNFVAEKGIARTEFSSQGLPRKTIQRADVHRPLGGKGFFLFDEDLRPSGMETWDGTPIRYYDRDALGRLVSVTDPERGATTFQRDELGRLLGAVLPDGTSAAQTFDGDGRVLTRTSPSGAVTGFQYGADGLLAAITWPDNSETGFSWNANRELVGESRASGRTFTTVRDAMGREVSTTDGDGETVYTRDAVGRRLTATRDGKSLATGYDARGRVVSHTDVHGKVFAFSYNALNELVAITYPDGSFLSYNGSHVSSQDRTLRCQAWGFTFRRIRALPNPQTLLASGTNWFANTVNLSRDFSHQLISTRSSNNSTEIYFSEIGPDNSGANRPVSRVVVEGPSWDPFPQAWTSRKAQGFQRDFDFPAGNSREWQAPRARTYGRGADGRVTTVDGTPQTYDPDGNLVTGMLPDGTSGNWQWDGRGNLGAAGGVTYQYDPEGNFSGWTDATGVTKLFTAPLFGRNTILGMETPTGETVWFAYDEEGLLADYSSTAGLRYYGFDPAGNTIWHGNYRTPTEAAFYEPFGELLASEGQWTTPFRFRGREGIPTAPNGLVWMRARHYNPALRSFVSPDPLLGRVEIPLSLDRYAFALNNPLAYSDPTGLSPDGEFDYIERSKEWQPRRIVGRVALVKGEVNLQSKYSNGIPGSTMTVGAGEFIFEGDTLRTSDDGRVKVNLNDGNNTIALGYGDQLRFDPPAKRRKQGGSSIAPAIPPGHFNIEGGVPSRNSDPLKRYQGGGDDVFKVRPPHVVVGVKG